MSGSTTFFCHPTALADALDNAVIIGNGTGRTLNDNQNSCPVVYLSILDGVLWVYGAGRFTMGRTRVDVEVDETAEDSIAIPVKSAKALQSLLRSAPSGADATAQVVIFDEPTPTMGEDEEDGPIWVDIIFSKNGQEVAALGDADPEQHWLKIIHFIDERVLHAARADKEGPMALTIENVNRLSSLRHKSKVVDFSTTDIDGVVAYMAGPMVTGVVGEIDRDKFQSLGGGTEEDLWAV